MSMQQMTVTKLSYRLPMSVELVFPWPDLPMWARKEWFRRGYGQGRRGPAGRLP